MTNRSGNLPAARISRAMATASYIGKGIISGLDGGTDIPPTGPPPAGYAYVVDISFTPPIYEITEDGDYVIAALDS